MQDERLLVKICCISSIKEAEIAIGHGADLLGLVSAMPSGPGVISESLIAEIAVAVGGRARTVILTSLSTVQDIVDQYGRCGVTGIQLCEWLDVDARRKLRATLPDAYLIQVVHVTGPEAADKAQDAQRNVDALLLDSGTLTGSLIELGGTGRTHDWSTSARIRASVEVPIFLAGGLNSGNVAAAVEVVRPAGVDVCSGLRTGGELDPNLVASFLDAVRS